MKRALLLAIVGGLLFASLLGAGWIVSGGEVGEPTVMPDGTAAQVSDGATAQTPNGTATQVSDGATIPIAQIADFDYADFSGELANLSNVTVGGTEDGGDDTVVEDLQDESRSAAEAGARDGVRLAAEQGVNVTAEQEQAAVDGAIRATAENGDATPDAVRAAAKGASHGTLLQSQESNVTITQIQASVYGGTAGALSQRQDATVTQLQSAAYGAAHGTTARHQHANVSQMQHAAVGAAAGATHSAVQTQQADVTQIQEAAQGGSYGALTQRQTATVTQIQAAAFGAAGGGAKKHDNRKKDPKKVQEASMGAATGALVQGQQASVSQIQAAARGAATGALVQVQNVSVVQIQQATEGAAQGAISQYQVANVQQIQAAATGSASGVLRQVQRVDIIQIQLAASGAAKGAAGAAAQYQITNVQQIQAAAAGAGEGSVIQIQQVNIQQVQVIAEGAAGGALSQYQQASIVQIQSAARGASEGALSLTQIQIINIQQIQIISERAAAETVRTAVDIDIEVEKTIYKYAKGKGKEKDRDRDPDLRSLFFDVDDETLFLANPNEVTVTVTVTSEDGDFETITLSPGESLTREFDPGVYTLTAESEDGRTVKIAGRKEVTVNLGPELRSLRASVEDETLSIENPNDDPAVVTVREDGDRILTLDVSATSERSQNLDPGEYTLTARIGEQRVPINGEERYEISIEAREIDLDVTVDGREVTIENPSDTAVTVTAVNDETDDERDIEIPAETTRTRTFEPGEYTLTGEADGTDVFLNGRSELSISISPPATTFSVRIVDVTDSVDVGESINVTAEISNDGETEREEEITLDIDDRVGLDSATVALGPGENETVTLTYQTTEDDIGERDVTVRSSGDSDTETVEVLDPDGDGGEDLQTLDSCTVISESGAYELADDIEGETEAFADESGDACIRVAASDVVLDGNDNAVVGAGENETVGILVAGTEEAAAENVTVRDLRAESWDIGIQVGAFEAGVSREEGEARLENVTANENMDRGLYVIFTGTVDVETVEANGNGRYGIYISEGVVDSMTDLVANDNGRDGVYIREGVIDSMTDLTANGNGRTGLLVTYTRDLVAERITVSDNGQDGIELSRDTYDSEFSEISASDNARHGIYMDLDIIDNAFRDSMIENNGGAGIANDETDRNQFQNVTVRDNVDWQVNTFRGGGSFTAAELRIGDAAEFAFDAEPVSLDDVDRDELAPLPEGAQAIGDGVEVAGIENGLDLILEYDESEAEGQIELWRYDGTEWIPIEENVTAADGSLEATLTTDGIYVPVLVSEDGDGESDTQTIDSCTVISESGFYELADDIEGEAEDFADESDNACIRIAASDVVLEGNGNAIRGAGEEGTIGILVAGTEETAVENVTIQNLQVEGWGTGIRIGIDDSQSEARLENVIASENENDGVYVSYSGSADIETIDASGNGASGIHVSEGEVESILNVTATNNGNDGLDIGEHNGVVNVQRITANGNGDNGVSVSEPRDAVIAEEITVIENGGDGVYFSADVYNTEFSEVYASGNAETGFGLYGDSSGNVVRDSTIENNGAAGIDSDDSARNEFRNVTVRDNEGWQIESDNGDETFSATDLRIGDTAEFAFNEEEVSIDDIDRGELVPLPEGAQAIGDGVEVEGIENGLDLILEYDDEAEGQIELWRYDGTEWTPVEEGVTAADGTLEATLTEDGIYAPVQASDRAIDLNVTVDEREVTIENPGDTAVTVTATDDETGDERQLEVSADETVIEEFDPGDYTLRGETEDGRAVTLNGEAELGMTVAAPDPAEFVIDSIETNDPIEAGELLEVTVQIENVGEETATQEVSLDVGDQADVDAVEIELDGGESETIELTYQTGEEDLGDLDIAVNTADATGTAVATVLEPPELEPEPGTEGEDGEIEDEETEEEPQEEEPAEEEIEDEESPEEETGDEESPEEDEESSEEETEGEETEEEPPEEEEEAEEDSDESEEETEDEPNS